MKLIIKTSDIYIEYEDEYSHVTEDAKKRIIEIMHSLPIPPKPIHLTNLYDVPNFKNK